MHEQATWLTKEHTLYSGEERRRPVPRGCLLEQLEGDHSIKWKVRVDVAMPEGKAKAVAYEPTRGIGLSGDNLSSLLLCRFLFNLSSSLLCHLLLSAWRFHSADARMHNAHPPAALGHTIGQYHGISPCPSTSVCEVEALDVIVVASDGLWNALGWTRVSRAILACSALLAFNLSCLRHADASGSACECVRAACHMRKAEDILRRQHANTHATARCNRCNIPPLRLSHRRSTGGRSNGPSSPASRVDPARLHPYAR